MKLTFATSDHSLSALSISALCVSWGRSSVYDAKKYLKPQQITWWKFVGSVDKIVNYTEQDSNQNIDWSSWSDTASYFHDHQYHSLLEIGVFPSTTGYSFPSFWSAQWPSSPVKSFGCFIFFHLSDAVWSLWSKFPMKYYEEIFACKHSTKIELNRK